MTNQMKDWTLQGKNLKRNNEKGLSGGVRKGPPPKRGPNPQGIKVVRSKHARKFLRKLNKQK